MRRTGAGLSYPPAGARYAQRNWAPAMWCARIRHRRACGAPGLATPRRAPGLWCARNAPRVRPECAPYVGNDKDSGSEKEKRSICTVLDEKNRPKTVDGKNGKNENIGFQI